MNLPLYKFLTLTLTLILCITLSCVKNETKPSHNHPKNEELPAIKLPNGNIKLKGLLLLDSKGLRKTSYIPEELINFKYGMISFTKTNVTIAVRSSYTSLESATNQVLKKNDIVSFIFSNLVIVKSEEGSNLEYLESVKVEDYITTNDFNFDRSFILELESEGSKEFRVLSIYTSDEENLERNIISAWESICWDKRMNLNITEKFIRIIVSNYNAIRKAGKWIN